MQMWLYRVLEVDDDLDPVDHGIVRAKDLDAAVAFVAARLGSFWDEEEVAVRFYSIPDFDIGIPESGQLVDVRVKPEKSPE